MSMIRAVLKNGVIQALDPPPGEWADGRELRVEEAEAAMDAPADLDAWYRELGALVAQLDPDDSRHLHEALGSGGSGGKGPGTPGDGVPLMRD
jgi:hypothetical protein